MIYDLFLACVWYLALTGLGILALPLSLRIFRKLPEGGILLSRPLGWLLVSYFTWILAYLHILPFSILGILCVSLCLLGLSIYLLNLYKKWTWRILRTRWHTARNGEILTLIAYLLILLARRENPSINSTEKPMDILFLNAITVSKIIPPPDPWLAGGIVNYHYGGYLLHSVLIKLTGIPPEYGYNLAIATIAAMGTAITFVLGRALFGRCRWGVVSVLCTLWIGNLASAVWILNHPSLIKNLYELQNNYLWNTSRVIHDPPGETINEYPFFTIMWGDLHPHFTNLVFVLFFTALVYALFLAMVQPHPKKFWRYHWLTASVGAISCGFLFPTNVFDFPIFSLLLGFCILVGLVITFKKSPKKIPWISLAERSLVIFLPIIGYGLAAPFWLNFQSPLQGNLIKLSPHHTNILEFLLVFGVPTLGTLTYLFLRIQAWLQGKSKEEVGFFSGLLGMVFLVLWGISGYVIYALTPLIALALWIYVWIESISMPKDSANKPAEIFALILCAMAWSLIAGCEFIYLQDQYGIPRMNTLFKFHFPAWIFLGIGLPYLLYISFLRSQNSMIKSWIVVSAWVMLGISLLGPIYTLSSLFLLPEKQRPITLDGLRFMKMERPNQYELIQWVKNNTQPTDRILEVPGCGYLMESTVSAFTGRPTVVGWVNHEGVWRRHSQEIYARKDEVLRFYTTQNWEEAKAILKKYEIRYVTYIPPECKDTLPKVADMQKGVFRKYLEPILMSHGNVYNAAAPYELYRVPPSL